MPIPGDEGPLQVTMHINEDGLLIVDFGKPVKWIGFPRKEALQFVETMMKVLDSVNEDYPHRPS